MENKRYYYTNPVAALWMMQNFNMEFESAVLNREIPFNDMLQIIAIGMTRPVVIKENSLSILEPQYGDLVGYSSNYYTIPDFKSYYKIFTKNDDNILKNTKYIKHEIIHRNGIVFNNPLIGATCKNISLLFSAYG